MTDGTTPGEERRPDNLGPLLRSARRDAGLNQLEVVKRAGVSQAQLSRIERGDSMPSVAQARALADLYELRDEDRVFVVETVEDHHEQREDRRFTVQRGNNILAIQRRFRRLDQRTRHVRSYSAGVVLGQLQVAGYAAAVMGGVAEDDPIVLERLARRVDSPTNADRRYDVVLAEGAIRLTVGSYQVMADQLDSLIAVSRLPNVDLRILGMRVVLDEVPLVPGFYVYDAHTVVLSQIDGAATLTDPEDVARYSAEFARLQGLALAEDEARTALASIRGEYGALLPR